MRNLLEITGIFQVEYRAVTPEFIFDQVPLADIRYEIDDDLIDGSFPHFNFSSSVISRRELLKTVSYTHLTLPTKA